MSLIIRSMLRADLPDVLRISQAFGGDWEEARFLRRLRGGLSAWVADYQWGRHHFVKGFLIYRLFKKSIALERLEADDEEVVTFLHRRLWSTVNIYRKQGLGFYLNGTNRRVKVKAQWLSNDVQALLLNPDSPAGVVSDALEEAGCGDRWLLQALRLQSAFASAVLSAVREEVTKLEGLCERR